MANVIIKLLRGLMLALAILGIALTSSRCTERTIEVKCEHGDHEL